MTKSSISLDDRRWEKVICDMVRDMPADPLAHLREMAKRFGKTEAEAISDFNALVA